jgi:hypothetical protein
MEISARVSLILFKSLGLLSLDYIINKLLGVKSKNICFYH